MSRPAILLAAYGLTNERGGRSLCAFTEAVRAAFPGNLPRWGFTGRRASPVSCPAPVQAAPLEDALSGLAAEGYSRIAVQPLHVAAGHEHAALLARMAAWSRANPDVSSVAVGEPLLTGEDSYQAVLRAMRAEACSATRPGEVAIWAGHGSEPPHDDAFRRLAALGEAGGDGGAPGGRVRIGYLTGKPSLEERLAQAVAEGTQQVCLLPFFALTGGHAARDLDGDGPDSWRSRFLREGVACRVPVRGLAETASFAGLWLSRLEDALRRL